MSTHPTIIRLSAAIDEATAADDHALIEYLRPRFANAEALAAQLDAAIPIFEQLELQVAAARSKFENAQRLVNIVGTHDRKLALQRRDDRDALQADLLALAGEYRVALSHRDSPAAALEKLGQDRHQRAAMSRTMALLERLLAEGHTRELAEAVQSQGEGLDPIEILWLGAAERRAFVELAARRASSSFGRRWHGVTDEHLATVFADRRQAIEQRRRRLLAQASRASSEASALTTSARALEAP